MENLLNSNVFQDKILLSKRFKVQGFILLFLGILSTLIPSIVFDVSKAPLIAILLYALVRIFLKRNSAAVFNLAYGVYLISGAFFLLVTTYTFGFPFLGGGDDKFFYEAGRALAQADMNINTYVDGVPLWAANYPGYLYILAGFYKVLALMGFGQYHFFYLSLLKICIGSLIPVLVFKIFRTLPHVYSERSLWILVLFPTLVIHTVSLLRESVISVVFLLMVYQVVKDSKPIKGLFWMLVCTALVFVVRPVHASFLVIFFLTYTFLSYPKYLAIKLGGLIIVFITLSMNWVQGLSFLGSDLDRVQDAYLTLAKESNQEGSIGIKLYTSNSLLLQPVKLVYFFLSPIPPPIVISINLLSIYISLGIIYWYLYVFGFFAGFSNFIKRGDRLYLTTLILFLVSGIVGVVSSKDSRHLIYIYPLIIPYGYAQVQFMRKRTIKQIVYGFLAFGVMGYIILKLF